MNILLVTTHLQPGGVPYYVVSLAEALKRRGNNIFVASSGGAFVEMLNNLGIEHIRLNIKTKSELSPKILFSLVRLLNVVKNKNIQIIHAQTRVTQVLSFFLSKLTGAPFVSTCHGFFKTRFFRRRFPLGGKKVIAISEAVKQHLINDFKIDEDDIKLIHNGIDPDKYKITDSKQIKEFKERIGLKDGAVVGIIARLSDIKGHKYLIEALKKVLDRVSSAQLLIVGDGKLKEELVALVEKLNIQRQVFFIPSVLDIALALSIIDIFVMPSLQEGLGLSIMQAQAAGIPVIGSSVGGITTLIEDRHTGILVPAKDAEALAQAILVLLNDKKLAQSLATNAQDNIRKQFSLEKMARETGEVYKLVLESR